MIFHAITVGATNGEFVSQAQIDLMALPRKWIDIFIGSFPAWESATVGAPEGPASHIEISFSRERPSAGMTVLLSRDIGIIGSALLSGLNATEDLEVLQMLKEAANYARGKLGHRSKAKFGELNATERPLLATILWQAHHPDLQVVTDLERYLAAAFFESVRQL